MRVEGRAGGQRESEKQREGRQGVDLSRAWGQPTRQKGGMIDWLTRR